MYIRTYTCGDGESTFEKRLHTFYVYIRACIYYTYIYTNENNIMRTPRRERETLLCSLRCCGFCAEIRRLDFILDDIIIYNTCFSRVKKVLEFRSFSLNMRQRYQFHAELLSIIIQKDKGARIDSPVARAFFFLIYLMIRKLNSNERILEILEYSQKRMALLRFLQHENIRNSIRHVKTMT